MSTKRIPLDPALYWQLSALGERLARQRAAVKQLLAEAKRTGAQSQALLTPVATEHGFAPTGEFQLDDEGCVLIVETTPEATTT